jgi:hypothetical protein
MTHIRRLAVVLAGFAAAVLALAANAAAAFAWPDPPLWRANPLHLPQPTTPAITRTVVTGGMPGWQIVLIAAGAALLAAVVAVRADRTRSARRQSQPALPRFSAPGAGPHQ